MRPARTVNPEFGEEAVVELDDDVDFDPDDLDTAPQPAEPTP